METEKGICESISTVYDKSDFAITGSYANIFLRLSARFIDNQYFTFLVYIKISIDIEAKII